MSSNKHTNTHLHTAAPIRTLSGDIKTAHQVVGVNVTVADPEDRSKTVEVHITKRQLHKGYRRGYVFSNGVKYRVKRQNLYEPAQVGRSEWAVAIKETEKKDDKAGSRRLQRKDAA